MGYVSQTGSLLLRSATQTWTYEIIFVRALVRFRYQNLKGKHHNDDASQADQRRNKERYLRNLPHDLFPLGIVVHQLTGLVPSDLVRLELWPVDLEFAGTPDGPPDAEIDLLQLPVLEEGDAPELNEQSKAQGVLGQERPGQESSDGREEEKHDVSLQEGKVHGHLGAEQVPDAVQVGPGQEYALAQVDEQPLVDPFVV